MAQKTALKDYPLICNKPETIFTPGGVNIEDITLQNFNNGKIDRNDCRTSKSSLLAQAEIARQSGNAYLAGNFERAAELVDVDNEKIIAIYNALRPYRSSEGELMEIASCLRNQYGATLTAKFVEDAALVLKKRQKLRGNR